MAVQKKILAYPDLGTSPAFACTKTLSLKLLQHTPQLPRATFSCQLSACRLHFVSVLLVVPELLGPPSASYSAYVFALPTSTPAALVHRCLGCQHLLPSDCEFKLLCDTCDVKLTIHVAEYTVTWRRGESRGPPRLQVLPCCAAASKAAPPGETQTLPGRERPSHCCRRYHRRLRDIQGGGITSPSVQPRKLGLSSQVIAQP